MKEDNLHNNNVVVSVQVDGKETQFAPYVVSVDTSTELHKLATAEIILRDGGLDDTDFIIGESDCFEIGKEITVMVGNDKADNCIFRGLIGLMDLACLYGGNQRAFRSPFGNLRMQVVLFGP